MKNKSPAFQFYPDKWESHTAHLSDYAYRLFHRMICWMWQHSKDKCSIPADNALIAVLMAQPADRIADAMKEILNPAMPLLKESGGKYINSGLKKEASKQKKWREKSREGGRKSAQARKEKAINDLQGKGGSTVVAECLPPNGNSPSLSPSPSPTVVNKEYTLAKELATELLDSTSEALGRKLTSTVRSSALQIEKMLKNEITSAEIRNTIKWLTTDNLKNEYPFQVLSGASLLEKWDKVQNKMNPPEKTKSTPVWENI